MADSPVYLDHNATTPVAAEVAEAMWPYLTEHFGNPSSASEPGRVARRAVEHAREQVAALIGADPGEVVFTSGGTESNNLAIRGSADTAAGRVAVTSAIEHPAVDAPLEHLRTRHGWAVHRLPVDMEARISVSDLPAGPVGLGTLILAHNEVGTIEPVAAFADAIHERGGLAHTDAAQAVGKIPVAVDDLGIDLMSIAGHKLYAPKGVGALYVRRGVAVAPVLVGAGQERGIRPGTENVASIVGLGAAAEIAAGLLDREVPRQQALCEKLWGLLHARIPDAVRLSPTDGALPNTLMVAIPGLLGAAVLEDVAGVSASTGSACHSGVHEPSTALTAMGLRPDTALGALRLSLGRATTAADIDRAAADLAEAVARVMGRS